MALDPSEVRHVARLANLTLQESEITRLTTQLGTILQYVQQLDELDTSQVEPTTFMTVPQMPLREDTSAPGLSNDEAMAAGPLVRDGAFAVPTFVDEG